MLQEARRCSDRITVRNIHEIFLQMEEAEDLFDLRTAQGTYYWDIVRRNVFVGLYGIIGSGFAAPVLQPPSLVSTAKDVAKPVLNRLTRRYVAGHAPKYIFITCQRVRRGAHLFDPVADPLFELLHEGSIAVELVNKTATSYFDILRGRNTRIPPVAVPANARPKALREIVACIASAVHKHFGISIDSRGLVSDAMAIFEANRSYYRQLFAEHRPKAVVCIDNATLKGMFCAAKEMQVPTLELQHGEINSRNPGYFYPKSVSSSHPGLAVPTALLTFSQYWNDIAQFPVRTVSSIGNDYFCEECVPAADDGILMASAYHYHEALIELARELADLVGKRKIYYKLHPHQFADKAAIVQACRSKSNIVVVSDELELSELLRCCDHVVGVHSTVTYIALQAGKRVCIYKRANYLCHDDVFAYVELFDSASELREIIGASSGKHFSNLGKSPQFFQPFDARRFIETVERVAR